MDFSGFQHSISLAKRLRQKHQAVLITQPCDVIRQNCANVVLLLLSQLEWSGRAFSREGMKLDTQFEGQSPINLPSRDTRVRLPGSSIEADLAL